MRKLALLLSLLGGCGGNHCYVECGSPGYPVVVHLVDDATNAPVLVDPTRGSGVLTAGGKPLDAYCTPYTNDMPPSCNSVNIWLWGPQTLHIAAPGYQPFDLATDVELQQGVCCPSALNPLDTTVRLKK